MKRFEVWSLEATHNIQYEYSTPEAIQRAAFNMNYSKRSSQLHLMRTIQKFIV